MGIGNDEANPSSSDSISALNSAINMFSTASKLETSQIKKTAIMVVLFVFFMLWMIEIRYKNLTPTRRTAYTIAEKCRFLAGILALIMVASVWVPVILWMGLVIWVILLAVEAY